MRVKIRGSFKGRKHRHQNYLGKSYLFIKGEEAQSVPRELGLMLLNVIIDEQVVFMDADAEADPVAAAPKKAAAKAGPYKMPGPQPELDMSKPYTIRPTPPEKPKEPEPKPEETPPAKNTVDDVLAEIEEKKAEPTAKPAPYIMPDPEPDPEVMTSEYPDIEEEKEEVSEVKPKRTRGKGKKKSTRKRK